jgi:hypothetical protein
MLGFLEYFRREWEGNYIVTLVFKKSPFFWQKNIDPRFAQVRLNLRGSEQLAKSVPNLFSQGKI